MTNSFVKFTVKAEEKAAVCRDTVWSVKHLANKDIPDDSRLLPLELKHTGFLPMVSVLLVPQLSEGLVLLIKECSLCLEQDPPVRTLNATLSFSLKLIQTERNPDIFHTRTERLASTTRNMTNKVTLTSFCSMSLKVKCAALCYLLFLHYSSIQTVSSS